MPLQWTLPTRGKTLSRCGRFAIHAIRTYGKVESRSYVLYYARRGQIRAMLQKGLGETRHLAEALVVGEAFDFEILPVPDVDSHSRYLAAFVLACK